MLGLNLNMPLKRVTEKQLKVTHFPFTITQTIGSLIHEHFPELFVHIKGRTY